ncbi:hypothetical protein CHS0354_024462 [Potamilus streckersoni]|uniref:RNase H type-1 domain-containing protein n=1 Tax=Potamilus streckersoni TaxID=2493646 RepID=A0AAE0TLG9_9BIVA|nr:hypothetical protein CHS0354_024462 [Potamilus streckersoni]
MIQDTLVSLRVLEENQVRVDFLWIPSHIHLIGNDKTDSVAKQSLHDTDILATSYRTKELYSIVSLAINKERQRQWDASDREPGQADQPNKTRDNHHSRTDQRDRSTSTILKTLKCDHRALTDNGIQGNTQKIFITQKALPTSEKMCLPTEPTRLTLA